MIRIGTTLTAPTGALFVAIGVTTLLWGSALAAAPVTQSARPATTVAPARQNAEKVTEVEGITEYRLANAGLFDRAGSWSMTAIAAPQNIARVESDLRDELARLLKDGITPEELAKAKSGIAQQRAQARAQDQLLAGKLRFDIDAGHTFAWDKQFEAHVEALTPEAVLAAARKYIEPAKISIVKGGDFAKVSKPN
jgi:predicted Zn-dependent peptidase